MATLHLDLVSSASATETGGQVRGATRLARVTGLSSAVSAQSRIAEAAGVSGLPAAGSLHPNYPELFLKTRTVSYVGPTIVDFTLSYEPVRFRGREESAPPAGEDYLTSLDVSLEDEQTQRDKNGDPIVLTYKNRPPTGVTVSVLRPREELTLERSIFTRTPRALARQFAGKVNAATTAPNPDAPDWEGGEPGTWLCTRVGVELVDRAVETGLPAPDDVMPLYRFQFTFRQNPNGWDPQVVYTLPETGEPPSDWQTEVGASATVEQYDETDFDGLPL
jgi:hypothetical protein